MLITEKDGFFNNANRKSTRTSHMENKVKQTWRSLESGGGGGAINYTSPSNNIFRYKIKRV